MSNGPDPLADLSLLVGVLSVRSTASALGWCILIHRDGSDLHHAYVSHIFLISPIFICWLWTAVLTSLYISGYMLFNNHKLCPFYLSERTLSINPTDMQLDRTPCTF